MRIQVGTDPYLLNQYRGGAQGPPPQRRWWWLLGLSLLVALGMGLYLWFGAHTPAPEAATPSAPAGAETTVMPTETPAPAVIAPVASTPAPAVQPAAASPASAPAGDSAPPVTPAMPVAQKPPVAVDWAARLLAEGNPAKLATELETVARIMDETTRQAEWQKFFQAVASLAIERLRKDGLQQGRPNAQDLAKVLQTRAQQPEAQRAIADLANALADKGEAQLQQKKYTTPDGDNAAETLSLALALDAKHARANKALDKVARKYVYMAQGLLAKNDAQQAVQTLERALVALPGHKDLLSLQRQAREKLNNPNGANGGVPALLRQAREQMAKEKWITPENDNAYDTYREVLRLKPGHKDARQGLRQIEEKLYNKAITTKRRGNPDAARALAQDAAKYFPDNQQFDDLLHELQQTEEEPPTQAEESESEPVTTESFLNTE